MISEEKMQSAAQLLGEAAGQAKMVLFGSYARRESREDSDIDFLVIEPAIENRLEEIVRLRQVLRPFRIPVDILVYTEEEVRKHKDWCSGALIGPCGRGRSFMTASTEEPILLLRKADQGIAAFDVLKNAPGIDAETALFHAQQAVEKCLKAVLAFHGVPYRTTHDIDELVDLVLDRTL